MVFVDRRAELDRIDRLAAAAKAGRPERHLALVGVRRIGKSRLIEHYVETHPDAVAVIVSVDAATTNPQAFLVGVVRACVDAVARATRGAPLPSRIAGPVEIAAVAGALGTDLAGLVAGALARANARRPDAQDLLAGALRFPEEVARSIDRPLLVFADEFQHLVDLASYPPFDGGRRRSVEEAQRQLLQVFRAHVERPLRVGWVVSGSAVRLMQRVLRDGALMGRFDELVVGPFDPNDTADLAAAIWHEVGVETTDSAVEQVFRLTQGHPFYTDVICRDAAVAALRLDQPVSGSMVDGAFVDAVRRPNGAIAIAAREAYDSLGQRAPNRREVLHVLARQEPASVAEIAERAQVASPALAYRHVQELVELGLVSEVAERTFTFADPVFRYWVAVANDPLTPEPVLVDAMAARRMARVYEEAYLHEREIHGSLQEGYLRDLCRSFAGQQTDGRRFGVPGRHILLPRVRSVERIVAFDNAGNVLGRSSEVELDLRFGDDTVWLGEVRRRAKKAAADDIERAAKKAAFLRGAHALQDGPTWFVSASGFTAAARDRARQMGVYTSDLRDIEALRNEIATSRV
jgi:hypothetical protein